MFDNTPAHKFISEETVQLDQDDAWVHNIYCRHLKPKASEEVPPVEVARQFIRDEIRTRCTNLERLFRNNGRPDLPFHERVQLVIEALDTIPYNGSYL